MRLRTATSLVSLLGAGALGFLAYEVVTPADRLEAESLVVEVPAHDGVLDIAGRLQRADAIRSRAGFVLLTMARGSSRSLKAGEYELERGATTLDVLTLIESGRVKQHPLLHPEGATVTELARALEADRLAAARDVLRLSTDAAFLKTLSIEASSLEGYLFPDTYQLVRGMTTEEILTRMVQRMRSKLGPDIAARAKARGLTVHQLLTLASIIEREAVDREEMRTISAVFWNRLNVDMPLQADPTVQYAAGKERRTLTRADLQLDHPYNTYRRAGLPPGPIASPGLAAIAAALDPAPVKYLYFVAIDDHRHFFSYTIEQHNAAVARYRLARAR
ncbi:MAG: endolytic transglycosylase MltG [Candidatus Rokuibacteriota bacterium]|nr:MAG: endolytic transglycosylase MltG [Candidatus Rokubacteria bacterium]